ncbi:hypothetical protein V5O48_013657 [Marasmius crinis-equi]|uniref:Uncharacterized protein n=1 Tax=Marasmius crinis-equi TaxID=585013 RepID=A0ABR3EZV5_9AGAR
MATLSIPSNAIRRSASAQSLPSTATPFAHHTTDRLATPRCESPSSTLGVYARSRPCSYLHDSPIRLRFSSFSDASAMDTLQNKLTVTQPLKSKKELKKSKSKSTLRLMNFNSSKTILSSHSSEAKKETSSTTRRMKKKMSVFFRRRKESAGMNDRNHNILEDDFVPGCMPLPSICLKKKKSFSFSKTAKERHSSDEKSSNYSRSNSLFRSRKISASSRMLVVSARTSSSTETTTMTTITDDSTLIATPDAPTQPQFILRPPVSPPPALPSPGFSSDNAQDWYARLIRELELSIVAEQQECKCELRRSRSFPGFRSSVSSWELDEMMPPPFTGLSGWYNQFEIYEEMCENEMDDVEVGEDPEAFKSSEEDAESVYRACEAMGGTGIVFSRT